MITERSAAGFGTLHRLSVRSPFGSETIFEALPSGLSVSPEDAIVLTAENSGDGR